MASPIVQQRNGMVHFSRKTATKLVELFYTSNREESNLIKLGDNYELRRLVV